MKFTSMFFTASAVHLRCSPSKIATNERETTDFSVIFFLSGPIVA
jgi:hypothetical protein